MRKAFRGRVPSIRQLPSSVIVTARLRLGGLGRAGVRQERDDEKQEAGRAPHGERAPGSQGEEVRSKVCRTGRGRADRSSSTVRLSPPGPTRYSLCDRVRVGPCEVRTVIRPLREGRAVGVPIDREGHRVDRGEAVVARPGSGQCERRAVHVDLDREVVPRVDRRARFRSKWEGRPVRPSSALQALPKRLRARTQRRSTPGGVEC